MEPGLPVWTIKPNWAGGILERLEWLTDVIAGAESGVEQRRSLRPSPRRAVEFTVNPTRNERTFLDLVLHRMGSVPWLFPLWFDQGKLSAGVVEDATRVPFDNTFREHGLGDYALLYKDAFTYEVVSIASSDATGINLADPVVGSWPKGTPIYPLRKGQLPADTSMAALTSRVGESVLLFQVIEANDYPEVMPADTMFEGKPVLTTPPNYSQTIDSSHIRLAVDVDNDIGIPYRYDPLGRAFSVQGHNWQVQGRQALASFRSLLYWLRGRQRAVWLPTFTDDVFVTRAAAQAATSLDVERIGMAYTGGVVPGRDVLLIKNKPARITALGAPQSPEEERLRIGAGLASAVAVGTTGSFMSVARLNQDSIELQHHTDIDGVTEIAATFQGFSDTRDPAGIISYPIPAAEMNNDPCGTTGDGSTTYEFWTVHVETSPPGLFGRPGLGNVHTLNGQNSNLVEYLCGDPMWNGARTSHFRQTRIADQWVETTISHTQQGQSSTDCVAFGAGYGAYYHYVKGNTWPTPKKCPATGVSSGELLGDGGIQINFFGLFPETAFWSFFPDFNDPRYLA